jgi:hypothetical protein
MLPKTLPQVGDRVTGWFLGWLLGHTYHIHFPLTSLWAA